MYSIEVKLSRTRQFPGSLTLTDASDAVLFGPVPCLGRADGFAAAQHNNAVRDPLKPFGDTPTGTYACTLEPAAPTDPADLRSYGPNRRILMTGTAGPALEAALLRSGLMIHGGAPGNGGGLRPTHGCLRLSDENMAALVAVVKEPCQCIVTELLTSSVVPTVPPTGAPAPTAQQSSGVAPV